MPMPQLNQVAESFIDGFGCLGAIFEPVVRPGSRENLIQEDSDASVGGVLDAQLANPPAMGELIWWANASVVAVGIAVSLSLLPAARWVEWFLRANDVLGIMVGTLFVREAIRAFAPMWASRSKEAGSSGAKASHGA